MIDARKKRRIVVGDVHGELDIFREIIRNAGLIDTKERWAGGDNILIQTGDVIDRGPRSVNSFDFLRQLQKEAIKTGGEVIRLCGNHELMILQGLFYFTNIVEPYEFADVLRGEISKGDVVASYTDGERLYTHAGLRSSIAERLFDDIKSINPNMNDEDIDLYLLSDYINRIFRASVESGELRQHPIFHIDRSRGGGDPVGGIFWCDFSSISLSEKACDIPQIFGHTPTGKNELKTAHELKLINVDAGMYRLYGGRMVYLEITSEGVLIQHSKKSGDWTMTVLKRK
ncbi:MAG TPA: metallophosphoesterase [Syntrophorhabdaceae bacterium]|nr:metallophosphoesterase [Syntrophorhabdaceae bacterium]